MKRRWLVAAVVLLPLLTSSKAKADDVTVRWDIATFTSGEPAGNGSISAGGSLPQCFGNSSFVTLTGSGTFKLNGNGKATGGGEWTIAAYGGSPATSGTYVVTEFVSFEVGPGTLVGSGLTDNIGNLADAHGGLAFLRILYSDGSQGVLVLVGTVKDEGTFYLSKGSAFYSFPACVGPTDNYPIGPSPIFHITTKGNK